MPQSNMGAELQSRRKKTANIQNITGNITEAYGFDRFQIIVGLCRGAGRFEICSGSRCEARNCRSTAVRNCRDYGGHGTRLLIRTGTADESATREY